MQFLIFIEQIINYKFTHKPIKIEKNKLKILIYFISKIIYHQMETISENNQNNQNKTNNDFISNIPKSIIKKQTCKLHNKKGTPINLIKERIYHYFFNCSNIKFNAFDELSEIVSTTNNFDLLLIPKNHPSRSMSDTYYFDNESVLRTHTSAHQNELLKKGETSFLVTGDVYRKDEIDRFHFPVFHQMEGVHIVENDVDPDEDLKKILTELVEFLFPKKVYRFNSDYFPFTNPSYEVEVLLENKWVEILGCGVIQQEILSNNGINKKGWAFGLGLERLAMIFYNIPDIRLFWSENEKFTSQFKNISCFDNIEFKPYPKLDSETRDIAFWLPKDEIEFEIEIIDPNITNSKKLKIIWKKENDFYDIVRNNFDTNIENIELIDEFYHPKKKQYSRCYRMTLNPMLDLSNPGDFFKICNNLMIELRDQIIDKLQLEVRG